MKGKIVLLWCMMAVVQQTCALYIPSRYRFPLRMVRPSITFYTSPLGGQYKVPAILEYFGKDRRTHTVTRTEERAGENLLRAALSKTKKTDNVENELSSKNSVSTSASAKKTVKTVKKISNQHEQHHRVAKNTDIVISSLLVRDSNGNQQKKYVVMRNNQRKLVSKPKPKTKVHNWWG